MCLLCPSQCCPHTGAAAEPRSPLQLPVSISLNPGALPALAQHGLELSLE